MLSNTDKNCVSQVKSNTMYWMEKNVYIDYLVDLAEAMYMLLPSVNNCWQSSASIPAYRFPYLRKYNKSTMLLLPGEWAAEPREKSMQIVSTQHRGGDVH